MKTKTDEINKIIGVLNKYNMVTIDYTSIYLNMTIPELSLLYIPVVAYYDAIKFDNKYKLFYLNTFIGTITFISDETVNIGIRCRIFLDGASKYYNEINEAISNTPYVKLRKWEILKNIKKGEEIKND
jgi:hypothetical protein